MTYIPYLGTFFFSRYPSVALARNILLGCSNTLKGVADQHSPTPPLSRSAIYANRSSKPVSHTTHTDQELSANQRQAAPSTERRS